MHNANHFVRQRPDRDIALQRAADDFVVDIRYVADIRYAVSAALEPSLHDVKATPVKAIHPGVEVLATALDNAKNQTYLYVLPPWVLALFTAAVLLGSIKLVRVYSQVQLSFAFVFIPSVLLFVSFISLHVGSYFVDLTLPAQAAFFMLSFVKAHAQVLAWTHARRDLMPMKAGSLSLQTIAATESGGKKGVADWSIFEALRHHTGVLYLDNRGTKHPLSDNDYRWWTIVSRVPAAAPDAKTTVGISANSFFQSAAALCQKHSSLKTMCLSELNCDQAFSDALARSHFWTAVAQHDFSRAEPAH
jgi:hypothetical protein